MFIIILTYTKPLTEVDKHRYGHLAFLSKFFAMGKFIVSGPQNPRTGGVIIANNSTKEQLENIVKEDPFYQNGVTDYNIIEFTPFKYQEAFKAFITDEKN